MEIIKGNRLTHAAIQTTPRPSLTCKDKLEYMNINLHTASHNISNAYLLHCVCGHKMFYVIQTTLVG